MEILYIGIVIILVWLGRTLHNIRARDQEEADKKIAIATWAKEQRDPHLVSLVQNLMSEGRFTTLEEAALHAFRTSLRGSWGSGMTMTYLSRSPSLKRLRQCIEFIARPYTSRC
jgi:hypothetical protein